MIKPILFPLKKGNNLKRMYKEGDGTCVEERQSAEVAQKEIGNKSNFFDI